jgi:uncharacterized protein YodC (DUF2158 family)
MADQFKTGEVVQLKSGGPKMTVLGYDVYGMGETEKKYKCTWFDDKHQLVEGYLTHAALNSVSD